MQLTSLFAFDQHFAPCYMQEAATASVDSVAWPSPKAILFCINSNTVEAYMAMLTWEVWDPATPGSKPEGLSVQRADFLSVSDTASSGQTPHMQAVVVPQWDVALAVHHNAYDYHMKVFGKYCWPLSVIQHSFLLLLFLLLLLFFFLLNLMILSLFLLLLAWYNHPPVQHMLQLITRKLLPKCSSVRMHQVAFMTSLFCSHADL